MFGDIGIGILLAIGISHLFQVELTWITLFLSIIFSLLPDIDMLIFVFPFLRKIFVDHRKISHYPILYIPIIIVIFYVWGLFWAMLCGLNILIHLIHDTLWIGHGITWLWPFSNKSYKFFSQDHKAADRMHWIQAFYLRPTLVSITEYGIFIISVIVLSIYK